MMRKSVWTNMGVGGLLVFLLLQPSCTTVDFVTGRQTRNMFSLQDDIALGTRAYNETIAELEKQGYSVSTDQARIRKVQSIMTNVVAHSHLPDLPYEVTLIEADDIVNAFAFPGGKFLVFTGLWHPENGIARDEDELAAIIGHEVAHVTCRHSTEEMTRHLPFQLLLTIGLLYAEVKEKDDLATVLSMSFMLYNGLWVTRYSRRNELEADRVGMMYMAQAGYDPQAAVRLWRRVHEHQGSSPSFLSIFSTHPPSQERYRALREHMVQAQAYYGARAL